MILKPALANLAAAASLGAIVGVLKLFNRVVRVLAVPLPVVAATYCLRSRLLGGAIQLARSTYPRTDSPTRDISARCDADARHGGTGVWRHGERFEPTDHRLGSTGSCLLFGLAAGASLVGLGRKVWWKLTKDSDHGSPGLGPWAGVIVFGIGAFLHFSAPQHSLWWMLLVLLLAFAAQQLTIGAYLAKEEARVLRHARRHPARLPHSITVQRATGDGDLSADFLVAGSRSDGTGQRDTDAQ